GLDVLELGVGVDEALDEPRAGDPVDVDPLAGDPRPASEVAQLRDVRRRLRVGGPRWPQLLLGCAKQVLELGAPRRAEVIDRDDLLQALPAPRQTDFRLGMALRRDLAGLLLGLGERVDEPPRELRGLDVVALAREAELLLDGVVGDASDEAGLAQRGFAAVGRDLVRDPFQVLAS